MRSKDIRCIKCRITLSQDQERKRAAIRLGISGVHLLDPNLSWSELRFSTSMCFQCPDAWGLADPGSTACPLLWGK